jgi:hypothetical protein
LLSLKLNNSDFLYFSKIDSKDSSLKEPVRFK